MGRKPIDPKEENPNIIRDMVGEKTDLSLCPECPFESEHPDCFARIEGRCTALSRVGKSDHCSFYKSAEQNTAEAKACYRRLKDTGRSDLISKYIKPLSAMGMLDDEIREAERYGEEFETFRNTDYREQLEKALEEDDLNDDLLDDVEDAEDEEFEEDYDDDEIDQEDEDGIEDGDDSWDDGGA